MVNQITYCANCGLALKSEEAICQKCDIELTVPEENKNEGKYQCQNCQCRFNQPNLVPWPPNAPWYYPQGVKPQCPHCKSYFNDLLSDKLSLEERVALPVILLVSHFIPGRQIALIALGTVFIIVQIIKARKKRASLKSEEYRYVVESNRT